MNDLPKKSSVNTLLLYASVAVFIVACVHMIAIFIGAEAYYFLDAKELGDLALSGSIYPAILTSLVVVVFLIFDIFALLGAVERYRTCLIQKVNFYIGIIFVARGLVVFYFIYLSFVNSPDAIPREIAFSLFSLMIGIFYLVGSRALVKK